MTWSFGKYRFLTASRYTAEPLPIHNSNQQWGDRLQVQDEEHGRRQASSESASAFGPTAHRQQLDERRDTIQNRPISMLEDFDHQFWLTSLGILSQEPSTTSLISGMFSGGAAIQHGENSDLIEL